MTTTQAPKTKSKIPVRVLQGLLALWLVSGVSFIASVNQTQNRVLLCTAGFAVLLVVKVVLDVRSRR